MDAIFRLVLFFAVVLTFGIHCQVILVEYEMEEEKPNSTFIGNIATDANITSLNLSQEERDSLEYRLLVQNNPHSELFHVNEWDGSLFVERRVDRETICGFSKDCLLNLDVICRSASGNVYKKIQISINVTDKNDNRPSFPDPQSVTVEMSEGSLPGTSVPIPGAEDPDAGAFSVQNYAILPGDTPFHVQFQTSSVVQIVLDRKLDRETRSSYSFQVLKLSH